MTLRRFALAVLCVCGLLAAPADAFATPSLAAFELSASGKRALSARSLSVTSAPRGPAKYPTFAIGGWTIGSSAKISLNGVLRFRSGKRNVSATGLSVTISRTSSYVTARLGGSSVRLFTLTPTKPAVLDAAQQHVSLVGARVALTRAATTRLKAGLRLRRAPSTTTLGKLTVGVAAELTQPSVTLPAPAPPVPTDSALPAPTPTATATPAPTATATPVPEPACADRFTATPASSVDWFSCDLGDSGTLKSWTNYVQRAFPAVPCAGTPGGTVVAGGGAARVVAGTAYDHRFPIASSEVRADGSATITVNGNVTYTMAVHGIDESIGAFRIEIVAGGQSGTVYADGRYKPFEMGGDVCTTAPQNYAGVAVLTLDLTGIAPVTADGVRRWVHVPAKIAATAGERIGGGAYTAGSAWGSFTIAVPAT
ncbi:HtaA domain-containing protein [Solirubrobacter ginsenosidimutans]|uniref:HtaA domain-containing protein n=1 Tax=Solirubrobacter ginsenosidimutans TaxID=490573 RepID=A0A9X3MX16_9ACTN|nr:HtaA domain-containing protein [Solirubrobacter ginsenosidimutans]MDA0163181.1 HtaA domain-containing protein [Solirubrobacter ginsenosidimutans]